MRRFARVPSFAHLHGGHRFPLAGDAPFPIDLAAGGAMACLMRSSSSEA
jgi:hypothetical protein